MLRSLWAFSCAAVVSGCAEPPPPRAAEGPAGPEPVHAPSPAITVGAPPAAPTASQSSVPVPPLSSPNPAATNVADAQAVPEPQPSDPRTAAIRRIGESAQSCHARHAAGIKGRLTLSVGRDESGTVTRVVILRAKTSQNLARPAFEACVVEAVKRERLSPARDEDHELELPLVFEPPP